MALYSGQLGLLTIAYFQLVLEGSICLKIHALILNVSRRVIYKSHCLCSLGKDLF